MSLQLPSKKAIMQRIIDRHVQLITQSNDCCLLTFSEMKTRFERAWDLIEFTRNPEEILFLHPDGSSFAERSPWIQFYTHPTNTPLYHQKVRLLHINKDGRIFDNQCPMFYQKKQALFLQLINVPKKKELKKFVETMRDFCIFPGEEEAGSLSVKYKKIIGTEIHNFLFPIKAIPSQETKEEDARIEKAIREINMEYLWQKKLSLQNLVELYRKREMKMHDLATLYRHTAHASEILLDSEDFNIKKMYRDMAVIDAQKGGDGKISDTREFNDVIGEKNALDIKMFVPAYRIYGHFALCCLEFFLVIKEKKSLEQCKACKRYYEKNHGNQTYCSLKCKKKGSNERSRKYRRNKTK